MRKPRHGKTLTYQKVLLAVYILADEDGITCNATCQDVARQAGISTSAAWKYLNELHADEVVNIRGSGRGGLRRLFLILDHPEAQGMLTSIRRAATSPDATALLKEMEAW